MAETWDLLPDGMVVVSREGTIAKENSQLATMFGYEIGELTGSPIEILLPKRFREAHPGHRASYMGEANKYPMSAKMELVGLRKDGSEVPVDIMLSPSRRDPRIVPDLRIQPSCARRLAVTGHV